MTSPVPDAFESERFDRFGPNVGDGLFYGLGRVNRKPPNPSGSGSGFFKAPAAITEKVSQQFKKKVLIPSRALCKKRVRRMYKHANRSSQFA
jgi:hypothetical protein